MTTQETKDKITALVELHPDASTLTLAGLAQLATPGPMGDDGRIKCLRVLRELEAEGTVERHVLRDEYYWTLTS